MPTGIYKHKLHTEEHKKNIGKAMKGRILTDEWKHKIALSRMGDKNWTKKPEVRKKISETCKRKGLRPPLTRGKDAPNWQGGKSFEPYSIDWNTKLKIIIRERDNYTCQECGQYGNQIHHIDYNKKNCELTNLITLCRSCHMKTNFNRKDWIKYFKNVENT
jgi:5-methylcytosine-specific restriction endonuclease McrA